MGVRTCWWSRTRTEHRTKRRWQAQMEYPYCNRMSVARRYYPLTVWTPLLYNPIGLGLKLMKRALKRDPDHLNLVTWGDENGPRSVPALGCLWAPLRQLEVQPYRVIQWEGPHMISSRQFALSLWMRLHIRCTRIRVPPPYQEFLFIDGSMQFLDKEGYLAGLAFVRKAGERSGISSSS